MFASSVRQRAGRKRLALPLREGELAGTVNTLKAVSLCEAAEDSFCTLHAEACWTYLACFACNSLVDVQRPLDSGGWIKAEERACAAVRLMTRRLLSHGRQEPVSSEGIEKDVKLARVNYLGEEVGSCHKLTLRQIEPALPPKEHGGCIDLMDFVSPVTGNFLRNPEHCILEDRGQQLPKLQGKIHVAEGELPAITSALISCGVCDWIPFDDVLTYRGEPVLNGLFGVPKTSCLSSGEPILRVIMNLVPSNSVMLQLEGAVKNLPSITAWMSLVADEGETIRIWQSDMTNAFYLFALPPQWRRCLAFNIVVNGKQIDRDPARKYALSCCVLPMGWLSSVSVMQEVSERILLRSMLPAGEQVVRNRPLPLWMVGLLKEAREHRRIWWHVYLDNYAGGQVLGVSETSAAGDQLHQLAEKAWREAQVVSSEKKRKRAVEEAEELGALVSGATNTIGASPERILKVIQATLWILSQKHLSKKHVQVVAGRWVHILQFRRPGMAFLDSTWQFISSKTFSSRLVEQVKRELWSLVCASPLLHTDLGATVSNFVTASDASGFGGAVGISKQLTSVGSDYVAAMTSSVRSVVSIPVLVISLFNGVGGCFRCYDILGLAPLGLISFDIHGPANRVSSRRWPHSLQYHDVREIDETMVRGWLLKFVGITEIHVWAGFPCTDLTALKSGREGLAGSQSKLFYEVPRVLEVLRSAAGELIEIKLVGENVASMAKSECVEISETLGIWPYHLNCSDAVPLNRPRLCWCSESFEGVLDGVLFEREDFWTKVTAENPYPDPATWIEPEVVWTGAESGDVLPTCLRAIIRSRPPPRPAGLSRCDEDTKERWKSEHFKFPPYQYLSRFLFWKGNKWRLIDSTERELLLGYGWMHTHLCMSASQIKKSAAAFENERLSLLGDSFSIYSFVIPAAALCKHFLPRMSYAHLCDRMGLAPGFAAPWRIKIPLARKLQYGFDGSNLLMSPQLLNKILLARVNHTGSDIRITTGEILNPKAFPRQAVEAEWWDWEHVFKFRWAHKEHINRLELRAIHQAVMYTISHFQVTRLRLFHLTDSYVCLSLISKGRSGSRFLNKLLKVLNANLLAHGITLILGHVESTQNPTDHASRSA